MFKTHAPNSTHPAIHVNCVLQSVQPDRAGYGNGSKSERSRCKKCVRNIARLHRCRFCSADITPTVYWLDYRKVNFFSLYKGRGKLIKLLKVQSETEQKSGQVRYSMKAWLFRQDVTMVYTCHIIEIQGLISKMSHFVAKLGGIDPYIHVYTQL